MTNSTIDQIAQQIPALRRFARALVGHPDRADDLVQDTLERAIARIDSFTPGTNLRAWLLTILRNNHINEIRRARMTATDPEILQSMLPPSEAGQEHGIRLKELQHALACLSPEMREVILLIGLEGLSYEEAASILGVKIGTVKSRLCRGREALRRLMDGAYPGPSGAAASHAGRPGRTPPLETSLILALHQAGTRRADTRFIRRKPPA